MSSCEFDKADFSATPGAQMAWRLMCAYTGLQGREFKNEEEFKDYWLKLGQDFHDALVADSRMSFSRADFGDSLRDRIAFAISLDMSCLVAGKEAMLALLYSSADQMIEWVLEAERSGDLISSFDQFQAAAFETAIYPRAGQGNWDYPSLGLAGEAGEVCNKIKKIARDDGGELTDERREAVAAEIGDCLWYLAALCTELGLELESVAREKLLALRGREERGALQGSGDDR